jgi:hypothetical protein
VKKIGNVQTKSDQVKHEMTALRVDLHPTQLVIRSDKTWETPKNGSSKMYLSSFVQPCPTQANPSLRNVGGLQRDRAKTPRHLVRRADEFSPKYAAKASRSNRAQELGPVIACYVAHHIHKQHYLSSQFVFT